MSHKPLLTHARTRTCLHCIPLYHSPTHTHPLILLFVLLVLLLYRWKLCYVFMEGIMTFRKRILRRRAMLRGALLVSRQSTRWQTTPSEVGPAQSGTETCSHVSKTVQVTG